MISLAKACIACSCMPAFDCGEGQCRKTCGKKRIGAGRWINVGETAPEKEMEKQPVSQKPCNTSFIFRSKEVKPFDIKELTELTTDHHQVVRSVKSRPKRQTCQSRSAHGCFWLAFAESTRMRRIRPLAPVRKTGDAWQFLCAAMSSQVEEAVICRDHGWTYHFPACVRRK